MSSSELPAPLPENESLYRALAEGSIGGSLVVDERGRILHATKRMGEIVGRAPASLIGTAIDALFGDDDLPAATSSRQIARPDGTPVDLELRASRDEIDGRAVTVISAIDVTASRNAESESARLQESIANSAAEWRGTFDAVPTPILLVDRDGVVLRLNQATCALAGKAFADILQTSLRKIGDDEPWQTAAELVHFIAAHGSATSSETRDAAGRTWDVSVTRFSGDDSPRCIVVLWEITGIIDLQESLRRSETLSAMGTLVAGVAHEVRNPLFALSATLDNYEDALSAPQFAGLVSALRSQIERMTQLMQELLEYGKSATPRFETESLQNVIADAIENRSALAAQKQVTIVSDIPATLPLVLIDRVRMRTVFENLIENAIQHSPVGAVVQISASRLTHGGREWIECRVEDSGPGFRADDVGHVFEPFFTRRAGGTGLGLSIVHRVVEEHSGRVTAANRAGNGAVFTVRLPVADA